MTHDLALKLKQAGLSQGLGRNSEYYVVLDCIMLRTDIHKYMYDELGNSVATNQFVYKPSDQEANEFLKLHAQM